MLASAASSSSPLNNWTSISNSLLYIQSTLDDKDRARLIKELGPSTGHFVPDYLRICNVLGVAPHPELSGAKRGVAPTPNDSATVSSSPSNASLTSPTPSPPSTSGAGLGNGGSITRGRGGGNTKGSIVLARGVATGALTSPSAASAGASSDASLASSNLSSPTSAAASAAAALAAAFSTEVAVRGWEVDLGTASVLALTLPPLRSLTSLRFWSCALSARSIMTLSDGLKNSAITRLYLDYNPLSSSPLSSAASTSGSSSTTESLGGEHGAVWSMLLAPSSPLQLLSLRGNGLGDEVVAEVMRVLSANKSLLALDLFDNRVGDDGCASISRMLGLNSSLQSLSLASNRVCLSGAKVLGLALTSVNIPDKEEAKVLKKLGFKVVPLKSRMVREANASLKSLNLQGNYLNDSAINFWLELVADQVRYAPWKGSGSGSASAGPTAVQEEQRNSAVQSPAPTRRGVLSANSRSTSPLPPAIGASSTATTTGTASAPVSAGSRTASLTATGISAASLASSAAIASAAATAAKDDDIRHPGQSNSLTSLNLSRQYARCTHATWLACASAPLVKWILSSEDVWTEDGRRNLVAFEMEEAAAAAATAAAAGVLPADATSAATLLSPTDAASSGRTESRSAADNTSSLGDANDAASGEAGAGGEKKKLRNKRSAKAEA